MPSPALTPAALVPNAALPSSAGPAGGPPSDTEPGAFARELRQARDQAAGGEGAPAQPGAAAADATAAAPMLASPAATPASPAVSAARGSLRAVGLAAGQPVGGDPGDAQTESRADANETFAEPAAAASRPGRRPSTGRAGERLRPDLTTPEPPAPGLPAARGDRLPPADRALDSARRSPPEAGPSPVDPRLQPSTRLEPATEPAGTPQLTQPASPASPASPAGPAEPAILAAAAQAASLGAIDPARAAANADSAAASRASPADPATGLRVERRAAAGVDADAAPGAGLQAAGDDKPSAALPSSEVPTAAAPDTRRDESVAAARSATPASPLPGFAAEGTRMAAAAGGSPPAPGATPDLPLAAAVTSPAFMPRLSGELAVLARDGVQQARVHVNPAELGPISVQITIDGTDAQVHLAVDSALTRDVLEKGLPMLAAALRETGLTLTGGGVFQQPRQNPRDPAAPATSGRAGTFDRDSGDEGLLLAPVPRALQRVGAVDLYA